MIISVEFNDNNYSVDLNTGIDISIPLVHGESGPKCFYAPDFKIEPVIAGSFIGDTKQGSPVNFKNIFINPHGNGTHTECVGHISKESYTINQCLKEFNHVAYLITLTPHITDNGEKYITANALEKELMSMPPCYTLIIRTLPNNLSKIRRDYSGSNPPYFEDKAMQIILEKGIKHLIVDLPSVDREVDGGKLSTHKIFWEYPQQPALSKTITEMVFIPNEVMDGLYFCQIHILSLELDASPSKILLYKMNKIK